jgi:hypothetical protein
MAAPFAVSVMTLAGVWLAACATGPAVLVAATSAGLAGLLVAGLASFAWHRRRDERVLFPLLVEVFDGHVVSVERDVTAS